MRVLVTGARGFVGGHLIRHLLSAVPGIEVHGVSMNALEEPLEAENWSFHQLQLKDAQAVNELIEEVKPDHIYHLAAQAFVPRSFEDPWETLENNIQAQLNIFQACLGQGIQPRILVISSAEIYGIVQPDELPITEEAELRPTSPYSVSKISQDMLALQYHISHGLPIMRARPFNHFGPGQHENFVAPSFAAQVARIEAEQQEPIIRVGDLSAKRDFTDVRDIVYAYRLIMEKGDPGGVYNIASGEAQSIQYLLDCLLAMSTVPITVEVDPARLRPANIPILLGDSSRLTRETGWQPQIEFEQSLSDVLDDLRQRIHLKEKKS